jgi:hypothetical protein
MGPPALISISSANRRVECSIPAAQCAVAPIRGGPFHVFRNGLLIWRRAGLHTLIMLIADRKAAPAGLGGRVVSLLIGGEISSVGESSLNATLFIGALRFVKTLSVYKFMCWRFRVRECDAYISLRAQILQLDPRRHATMPTDLLQLSS